MRSSRRLALLTLVVALAAPAVATVSAQDPYERRGFRDRVNIRAGAFFLAHDTFALLRPDDTPEIPGVDLEFDAAIPDSTTDFRIDGHLRLGRRHRIEAGYFSMDRDSSTRLTGEIRWDDEVFPIDAEIKTVWDTRIVNVAYRYSLMARERFDWGLSAGLFAMDVRSGIGLATQDQDDFVDVKNKAPLPLLGTDLEWLPVEGFLIRGSLRYFAIKIGDVVDGKWGEYTASAEWYPHRNVGIGAAYKYTDMDVTAKIEIEGDPVRKHLEYNYKFNGPLLYLAVTF